MKKAELEEAYRELQYRYNKLHSDTRIEIENLKQENKLKLENQQTYAENKAYETWKMMNGKFMKRYIEELIMQDVLQFSFKSGYRGHFDMEIRMGDKFLTSVDGDICMKENSLEW
jgi:uncharacterized protein YajQ (UPF0234 family)